MSQSTDHPAASQNGAGARLHALRLARHMTQRELAGGKYSVSYISAIERGRVKPSLGILTWCASRLDVSPAELLGADLDYTYSARHTRLRVAESAYAQIRAELLLGAGSVAEARRELREQRQRLGSAAPKTLIWMCAYAAYIAGDFAAAQQDADLYVRLVTETGTMRELASAHWLQGLLAAATQHTPHAISEYQRALALHEQAILDPDFVFSVRGTLADALMADGNESAAYDATSEALAAYEVFADPMRRAARAEQLARLAASQGDFINAYMLGRWAWFSRREVHARSRAAALYLAHARSRQPATPDTRERDLRRAYDLGNQGEDTHTRQLAAAFLAIALIQRNQLSLAEQILQDNLPRQSAVPESMPPRLCGAACLAYGWLHQARGEAGAALDCALAAEQAFDSVSSPPSIADSLAYDYQSLCDLFEALGETKRALNVLRRLMPSR